ncbi:hypothetical protein Daesc_009969 [Daldinia eschscholtzii]|uniref:HNH nuclease domain-containing protein n=1 Tax=Daldinia eschscholtzii TaxID=292717 RepID=A0AAX6M6K8_9PEZI
MRINPVLQSHFELIRSPDEGNTIGDPPVIEIFHPGYLESYCPLLQFVAWDDGGVDYNLVYYACCILVGNAWPDDEEPDPVEVEPQAESSRPCRRESLRNLQGINYEEASSESHASGSNIQRPTKPPTQSCQVPYLSLDAKPNARPIPKPNDGILRGQKFFLHVPGADRKFNIYPTLLGRLSNNSYIMSGRYAITPTFNHWIFPHNRLPKIWRDLPIDPISEDEAWLPNVGQESTHRRDHYCRLTNALYGNVQAHLIPRSFGPWFMANHMNRYCSRSSHPSFDDISNTMLLRYDVYKIFDNKEFVFVPKADGEKLKIVSHVLQWKNQWGEIRTLYHNRECRQLRGIRREYMFARFAWSIFNNTTLGFLDSQPQIYNLCLRVAAEAGDLPQTTTVEITSKAQIPPPPFLEPEKTRESSTGGPKRRKRVGYFSVSQERAVYPSDDEYEYVGSLSGVEMNEEEYRGRKREQLYIFDNDTVPDLSRSDHSLASSNTR